MSKFQVFRPDLNKIVAKEVEAADAVDAFGKYASILMVAGMIAMRDRSTECLEDGTFRVNTLRGSSFIVKVRPL